jgi:Protein of unknown function (DUF3179)
MRARRAVVVLCALVVVGGAGPAFGAADGQSSVAFPQATPSPREDVPAALDNPSAKSLPRPTIDPAQLRLGGPPPDGIPAIDHPRFEPAGQVDWLDPREPVLAFDLGTDARAYPVRILIWHEIVNDTIGGVPVAVTYCPLCNSAIAFDRRAAGRVLDFGTSGLLLRSDLVMYDRQTRSLWPQFEGRAVAGFLTDTSLEAFPVSTISWREWRDANPAGWVLSRDTGFDRQYGTNPYTGYDEERSRPFLYNGKLDSRLAPKARVVGLDDTQGGIAVTFAALRARHVMQLDIGDQPIVVWWKVGTASPLDDTSVSAGRDVGASQAFDATVDGQHLHFTTTGNGTFRDVETGSSWDFLGHATSGPLQGRMLEPVEHLDTFWFAWAAFHPHTRIVGRRV